VIVVFTGAGGGAATGVGVELTPSPPPHPLSTKAAAPARAIPHTFNTALSPVHCVDDSAVDLATKARKYNDLGSSAFCGATDQRRLCGRLWLTPAAPDREAAVFGLAKIAARKVSGLDR